MAHVAAPPASKPPAPAKRHRPSRRITPVTASNVFWLAAGYGLWASVTTRHEHGVTGYNVLYG
ncbi:membrane protein, partial [Streptomyces sp. NRRL F-6602]